MELDRGTYSEGAVFSKGIFLSPASSIIPVLFSFFASFPLSPSPSFSLSLLFSFSLSPLFSLSLPLSLSCCFRLDWVLADVKNGLADCSFLRCRERLY